MFKKLISILLCVSAMFLYGCDSSRRIESAAIIENITVDKKDGKTVYTFYILKSGDVPQGVSVSASSFEDACEKAGNSYIPNLSLAKLELLLINADIYQEVLRRDVAYISTQPSFSPIAYVALCDSGVIKLMEKDNNGVPAMIENQLILEKNNNYDICIDYLSVFNSISAEKDEEFSAAYVTYDGEINVKTIEIS